MPLASCLFHIGAGWARDEDHEDLAQRLYPGGLGISLWVASLEDELRDEGILPNTARGT